MKTVSAKNEEITRTWHLVDAKDQVLGRLATELACVLRGKRKPIFTPHVDTGDFVVVINAEKVKLTGRKYTDKVYYRHSGYPGGLKSITADKLLATKPEMVIQHAVRGMLPKNKLGRQMIKKLKVYAGPAHPHEAQQPVKLDIA